MIKDQPKQYLKIFFNYFETLSVEMFIINAPGEMYSYSCIMYCGISLNMFPLNVIRDDYNDDSVFHWV